MSRVAPIVSKLCQPTCPHFKCSSRALIPRGPREPRYDKYDKRRGREEAKLLPLCNMDREPCQGARCKFAFCEVKALLVNGRCGLEDRLLPKPKFSIEEEVAKLERDVKSLEGKLRRRGILEEL
ncbi:MAG: hypothetical protein N3H31_07415 [Candidatus Nezhaarchaeota archaeon]|nr:hypothetical protein [Candidatus Nezhaarchaeota archaeon]